MKRTLRPAFIIAVTLFVTGQTHLSARLPDGRRNDDILADNLGYDLLAVK